MHDGHDGGGGSEPKNPEIINDVIIGWSLRWSYRYLEMLLRSLEGILSPTIHFCPESERQPTKSFSAQILILDQYWVSRQILVENEFVCCRSDSGQICILELKIPSSSVKNISKYLQNNLRPHRISLKKT